MSRGTRVLVVVVGVVAIAAGVVVGLGFAPVRGHATVIEPVPLLQLVSYTDPYGSSDPGGASTLTTDPGLVAGSYPMGDGATEVGNGVDGLSVVPVVMLGGVLALLPLWWVVRWFAGLFSGG